MIPRDAEKQFEGFQSEQAADDTDERCDDAGCRAVLLGLALIAVKTGVAGAR